MALQLRFATPAQIPAGFWDECPFCQHAIFLPIAGGKESKEMVRCPSCLAAIKPDC